MVNGLPPADDKSLTDAINAYLFSMITIVWLTDTSEKCRNNRITQQLKSSTISDSRDMLLSTVNHYQQTDVWIRHLSLTVTLQNLKSDLFSILFHKLQPTKRFIRVFQNYFSRPMRVKFTLLLREDVTMKPLWLRFTTCVIKQELRQMRKHLPKYCNASH